MAAAMITTIGQNRRRTSNVSCWPVRTMDRPAWIHAPTLVWPAVSIWPPSRACHAAAWVRMAADIGARRVAHPEVIADA